MAVITRFKSVADDGGTIGDEITSGTPDELLPPVTVLDRLNGATILRKMWLRSDSDIDVFHGFNSPGYYTVRMFVSAGANDTVADLTGNEDRYGVTTTTGTSTVTDVMVETPPTTPVTFRVNDYLNIAGEITQLTAIADNGDGTTTFTVSPSLASIPAVGTVVSALISQTMVTGADYPFWIEEIVPSGAARPGAYNNVDTVALY
jgi:hypothetical protein